MVVTKLESYIHTSIPGALHLLNLKELIKEEISRGVVEPTVVLDQSAAFWLFRPDEASILDLQPAVIKENVERFVKSIISCKARLIVVVRNKSYKTVESWFTKNNIINFNFYDFKVTEALDDLIKIQLNLPSKLCCKITFLTISNEKYSAFISDDIIIKTVAEVAVKQNCLAVIGQDSNYLIYEGIRHYIWTASININTLDCMVYDRNKVIQHLGLKSYHLPLFATLCGNDVVNFLWLKDFHKRISYGKSDKFLNVARIIRKTTSNPYSHVNELANLIGHPEVSEKLLEKSLDLYLNFEIALPTDKWLRFANQRLRNKEWSALTFQIFTKKEFRTSIVTKLDPHLPVAAKLLRPLREKIYGILFCDLNINKIAEYCVDELKENQNKYTPVFAQIIPPDCEHPGLFELFNTALDVKCIKWDLFCSAVMPTLQSSTLRKLSPKLIIPVLALHYLNIKSKLVFSKMFELEAFLVVAVLVSEGMPINYEIDELGLKETHLTLLYIETCCMLQMLNEACGLVVSQQDSCFCNFYNGVLLFYVYKQMEKGVTWEEFFKGKAELKNKFCALMDVILIREFV